MSAGNHRWLVMRLEAPLMAFGGVAIDHIGVTRDFPAASMMTGLLASALGFDRTDWEKHQRLQDRLVFAACRDREARKGRLTDTQNAKLQKNDKGWTTRGSVETRGGDKGKMDAPHRRRRDFHMDTRVIVVLRLAPDDTHPTLDDIANALDHPARPLFLGRKPCLPARPLLAADARRFVRSDTAHGALSRASTSESNTARALWPVADGPKTGADVDRIVDLQDLKNWRTGMHGGARTVVEGRITIAQERKP